MQESDSSPAARTWVQAGSPAYRRISLALFLAGFATFSLLYCVQPVLPELAAHFGLGAAGKSHAEILARYYVGSHLHRLY